MSMCKVHNVKFYKLEPRGINCMAYEKKRKKLALCRSDASIEIWNLNNIPHLERTFPNDTNSSIEALCWYNKRLFSTGLSGELIEYNLNELSQKYAIPITGGVGWCMDIHKKTSKLVIGTEQGFLNLFSITGDGVQYIKILDKQEGRILCLKFNAAGDYVASGSVDTIRIWNVKSGHAVHKMNLSRRADNTETVVWCLVIVDKFTVVSGDSRGFITFWDGATGSHIESYQSHCAAVYSICLSDNGKTIYCAGVDPLIMSYEKISMKGNVDKWVKSIQRNIHNHDVRSLIYADNRLYSGGIDGYLACSYYPPKTLVKYPPLLQNPCVSIAHEKKYILLRYPRSIEIWKLGQEADALKNIGVLKLKEEPVKLLEIQTKGEEGTLCATISNNGQMIAYSTLNRLRLFHFNYSTSNNDKDVDGEDDSPELTPYDSLPENIAPCARIEFSWDNKLLVLATKTGLIQILNITANQTSLAQTLETGTYLKDTITFLNISNNNRFIVVADADSNIVVFHLQNKIWKFYVNLPRYECPPTAVAIHPTSNELVVVYSDHKIIEYNLEQRKFTSFSRSLNEKPPRQWLNRSFPVINVTFNPKSENILMLHDDANICVIDKEKKIPSANVKIPKLDASSSLDSNDKCRLSDHAFHIIKRSKHLVYFGWISEEEMLSVELNALSLLDKLPPGLKKEKFGKK